MTVDENGKDTDAPITFSIEVEPSVATASFSEEQPASVPHITSAAVKILMIFFIVVLPFSFGYDIIIPTYCKITKRLFVKSM